MRNNAMCIGLFEYSGAKNFEAEGKLFSCANRRSLPLKNTFAAPKQSLKTAGKSEGYPELLALVVLVALFWAALCLVALCLMALF